ncbi:MAG TPA: non-homologous end-joining DNA ligase [Pirellulales bacterium]|nr:non-homologous end-joining DNA ligase [Pirellulales bacterium]
MKSAFRITHPDRIVYPDAGVTKGQIANYYIEVADWILPHVTNRPLVLVRCPEGLAAGCFYQKHPPVGMPSSVQQISIREKTETRRYAVVQDLEGLIALVQFGTLEIHAWGSPTGDIERPDRMIFDLDPDPAVSWHEVVEAAFLVRDNLKRLRLTSFVKTTGGKGLHIVVPLAQKQTWPEVKQFTRDFADSMVAAAPHRYIATMSKAARRGKIFVDYLRNERGATSVVPYSTRAKPGASVSMPITWAELSTQKGPQQYSVKNAVERLKKLRSDPWREIWRVRQSLPPGRKR